MLTNKLTRILKVYTQGLKENELGELTTDSLSFLKKVYAQVVPMTKRLEVENNENDIIKTQYKIIIRKKSLLMSYDLVFELDDEWYDVDYWNKDFKNDDFVEVIVSKRGNV